MSPDSDDRPDGAYIYVRRPKPESNLGEGSQLIGPAQREARPIEDLPLPPPKQPAPAGPPAVDAGALDLALEMGPGPMIDLEAPPPPVDESERMPSIDLLDLSAPAPGAGFESPSFRALQPEPTAGDDDEPGWGYDVAEVPKAPSPFERSALHADRNAGMKIFLPPPPEPWWKRRLPHMIVGSILILISSYVYGCTKVMGDSIAFRRNMGDVGTELRNLDGKWETVTPAKVKRALDNAASKHDMKIKRFEVHAEAIGQIEIPGAGCRPASWPDTIMKLDPIEQLNLAKLGRVCAIPNYIVTVRAAASGRWGLFEHSNEEVTYVLLNRYGLSDEPPAETP